MSGKQFCCGCGKEIDPDSLYAISDGCCAACINGDGPANSVASAGRDEIEAELGVLIILADTYVGSDRANAIQQQREKVLALIAPPAPGEVTIRLKHHDAQKALDALNYGISDWVRFHGSAEDIDWMVAERDALTAALAAAPGER